MRVSSRLPVLTAIRFAVAAFFLSLACVPAFAGGGAVLGTTLTTLPGGNDALHRALVQSDGKIVVAGYARYGTFQFTLVRYNADGTLDTTFNNTGVRLEYLAEGESQAWALAESAGGKITIAGYATTDRTRFGVARFNADGSLDTTFGGGGKVYTIGPGDAAAYAMAIDSNGQVLLGGYSIGATGKKVFTIIRLQAGTTALDTTFGNGGIATAPEGASDEVIRSMAIQSDGKIVVAGEANGYLPMRRFNSDGSLDSSWTTTSLAGPTGGRDMAIQGDGKVVIAGNFNDQGIVELAVVRMTTAGVPDSTFGPGNACGASCPGVATVSNGDDANGYGLVLQSDGKIVISGSTSNPGGTGFALARFNSNGTIDTSFGTSGTTSYRDPAFATTGYGVALRSNGGFVMAGLTGGAHGDTDSLTVAFTAAGALDTTFHGNGLAQLDVGSPTVEANASVLQSDGKLVVVGTTTAELNVPGTPTKTAVVARYLASGILDSSFGNAGITLLAANSEANAVALQSTGKIVIGGVAHPSGGVPALWFTRVNLDGTVDTNFGPGGTFSTSLGSTSEGITSIAVQSDDKIVAGGFVQNGSFSDAAFIRLGKDGGLDSTFNGSGLSVAPMSTGSDQVNGIAIQGDGKIVGAGWAEVSGSQDSFTATRVNGDGTIDTNFGTNGVATINFGTQTSHGNAMVLQPDGKIVIGGQVFNGSTDDFAIARLNGDGTLDPNFGNAGIQSNDFGNHNRIFGLALLSNGKIVGAGETGGLYSLVQYMPNGTLDTSFGTGGSVSQVANAGIDHANAITIAADGSYFAAGDASGLIGVMHVSGDASGGGGGTTADISVSQAADPGTGSTGRDLLFAITVTNNGPSSASSIVVTDTLPSGWSFVWAMQGCSNSSNTVTCNVATLASGQSRQFWVVGRPATAGVANNTVHATAAETDPNLANNTSSLGVTVSQSPSAVAVVRYRLYSPVTQEHLFTTDQNEYNTLGASGNWNQEGTSGEVLNNPGSFNGVTATPYYRLYNTTTRWHHWTTDPNEYYTLIQFPNWNAEGVDGFLLPTNTTGATQLYRLVYPDGRGLHHWTIDANEYNTLITTYGWVGEGGTGFVIQGP